MPTYEYKCTSCGHRAELFHPPGVRVSKCPECGGPFARLVSGGCGLIFKGPGFYVTDYKDKRGSRTR